jgi:alpha-beta hydrolase superfamily lysophospholipase
MRISSKHIVVLCSGPEDANQTVVLVHGIGGYHEHYDNFMPFLQVG